MNDETLNHLSHTFAGNQTQCVLHTGSAASLQVPILISRTSTHRTYIKVETDYFKLETISK